MSNVARAGKNIVTAHFTQNLSSVNKAGEMVYFDQDQTFSSDTLTEITSRKVGLWLIGVLKHFIKLSRLQGSTGFKMSKPIELELSVNNKTETMRFKFTLSAKRLTNLLERYPSLVCEAFMPSPAIGNITEAKIEQYFNHAEDLVIAPAKKQKQLVEASTESLEVSDSNSSDTITIPVTE